MVLVFSVVCVVFVVALIIVSTAVAKSLIHIHLSRLCKGLSSPSRYLPVHACEINFHN